MKELSVRIRRAAARWLFCDRDNRMHYVAEEYKFGGRCADVIGYSRERQETRGVYRKVTRLDAYDGRFHRVSERVGDKVKTFPPEVRIVEVKISRADLQAGIRKGQIANDGNGLGTFADLCYLAGPKDLITARDLPIGWGLLEFEERPRYDYQLEREVTSGAVVLVQDPVRLAPSRALTAEIDLAHRLAQSALWRLYGFSRASPEQLEVAR